MKFLLVLALINLAFGKPALKKNPMFNEGLFEGDIMGIDPYGDRNAIPKDSQRWPNGVVPYVIDKSLYGIWETIMKGMQQIQQSSCIRFVQRTHEKDYVKIFKGEGCWSFWGRLGTGEQKASLGAGCEYVGTVVHELLHALGFEHEHNRSDRDDYLTINWPNIEEKWYYAFQKLLPHEHRLLTPFDYDSIMLYGGEAFTKQWGLKTIVAKDGRPLPDDKPRMSKADVKRLNMLYNCPKK